MKASSEEGSGAGVLNPLRITEQQPSGRCRGVAKDMFLKKHPLHLSSAPTTFHLSTSSYQMRQDSICWLLDRIYESVGIMSVRLYSVISGFWLGGALVSALCICCFQAHRLLYGTFLSDVWLLFYIAIPIPEVSLRASSNCP